jgi:predicted DCC family thiol-disulfide oxidoreductase YuxK
VNDRWQYGVTTYYNGKCPVCAAGVADQRRRAARANAPCSWVDINDEPEALAAHGIALDDVRLRLHAVDGEGRLRVGPDAFAAIWGELPHWRWLARLVSLPGMRTGVRWLYDRLAYRLYAWNQRRGRW